MKNQSDKKVIGLARPVGPQKTDDLARLDVEAYAIDRVHHRVLPPHQRSDRRPQALRLLVHAIDFLQIPYTRSY